VTSPAAAVTLEQLADDQATVWLVARLAAAGGGDFGENVARPLAVSAMCRSLGLDLSLAPQLDGWYRVIAASVEDGGDGRAVSGAAAEAMIGNAAWSLVREPGLIRRVRADPELISRVVDESTRLFPAAASVHRYTTRAVELAGVRLPSGAFVDVSLLAANRDPQVFDHSDRFDVTRTNLRDQLTFARGPHMCIGIGLARHEAQVALQAMLDVGGQVRLGHDAVGPHGHTFVRPRRLSVVVDG